MAILPLAPGPSVVPSMTIRLSIGSNGPMAGFNVMVWVAPAPMANWILSSDPASARAIASRRVVSVALATPSPGSAAELTMIVSGGVLGVTDAVASSSSLVLPLSGVESGSESGVTAVTSA